MDLNALTVHRGVQAAICRTTLVHATYAQVANTSKIIAAKQYALQVLMQIYRKQPAKNVTLHAMNVPDLARVSV